MIYTKALGKKKSMALFAKEIAKRPEN